MEVQGVSVADRVQTQHEGDVVLQQAGVCGGRRRYVGSPRKRTQQRDQSRTCVVQIVLQPAFGPLVVELPSARYEKKQVVPERNTGAMSLRKRSWDGPDHRDVDRRDSPGVRPLVRVELGEEPGQLQQHGDAAAVGVGPVGQPLSGTGGTVSFHPSACEERPV